jgi:hypothetical protein
MLSAKSTRLTNGLFVGVQESSIAHTQVVHLLRTTKVHLDYKTTHSTRCPLREPERVEWMNQGLDVGVARSANSARQFLRPLSVRHVSKATLTYTLELLVVHGVRFHVSFRTFAEDC